MIVSYFSLIVIEYGKFLLTVLSVIEVMTRSNVAGYLVIPKALVSKALNCHSNVIGLKAPYEQMSGLIGIV